METHEDSCIQILLQAFTDNICKKSHYVVFVMDVIKVMTGAKHNFYVIGTHWNSLYEAIPRYTNTMCY